jgi:uncharacterized protein (DUF2267 family)
MTTASGRRFDVFSQAEQTAHDWLATVTRYLATEDPHHAYGIVRAWLHTVRDRLPVDGAAHFAAQLPLVWRGLFYDGWQPRQVPVKYTADQFLMTVAQDANLSIGEARQAAAAVTAALQELTSPDQVGHLLAQLPGPLREVLEPSRQPRAEVEKQEQATPPEPRSPVSGEADRRPVDPRVERLEQDVQVLVDALGVLVQALEESPSIEPEPTRRAAGARRAHQILLSRTSTG